MDNRLRAARGIAKTETEASIEVFETLKRLTRKTLGFSKGRALPLRALLLPHHRPAREGTLCPTVAGWGGESEMADVVACASTAVRI